MPKARKAKRKNAGVGVDFARVKRRVGRKLAPADNATDTRVVARRVTLPGQSLAEERGVAVSERNLTLKVWLEVVGWWLAKLRPPRPPRRWAPPPLPSLPSLLRNSSSSSTTMPPVCAKTRSWAWPRWRHGTRPRWPNRCANWLGIGWQLAAPPPPLLLTHTPTRTHTQAGRTLEALAERAADPDPTVRAALPPTLAAVATALAPAGGLTPFMAFLMAHARRALTATDPATRRDGLALAACVARSAPRGAAAPHVAAALDQCSAALATRERARSLKAGSMDALGGAVGGVKAFLEAAFVGGDDTLSPPTPTTGGPLFARKSCWVQDTTSSSATTDRAGATALLTSLTGALADAAAGEGAAAAAVAADIIDCARLMVADDPPLATTPSAVALADAVGVRLPAPAPGGAPTAAALDSAAALNVSAARFLARMLPQDGGATPPSWAPRLLTWCDAVAARGDALPPPPGTQPPPTPLRPLPDGDATASLMTCLDAGLMAGGRARGAAHAAALASVCARAPPPAPAGAAALAAQAAVLVDPRGRLVAVGEAAAAAWVRDLPQHLWHAGSGAVRARGGPRAPALASLDAGLSALLDAARYGAPNGPLHAALASVADQLAPLLAATAPPQKPGATPRLLPGVLAKLPPAAGLKFVDAWHYLPSVPAQLVAAGVLVVVGASLASPVGERGLVTLARRVACGDAGVDGRDLDNAVATLLEGGGAGGGAVPPLGWEVHSRALSAARAVLAAAGPAADTLLANIAPRLVAAMDADGDGRAAAGCLAAAASVETPPSVVAAALPRAVSCYTLLGGAAAGVDLAVQALSVVPASLAQALRELASGAAAADASGVTGAARTLAAITAADALRPALMKAAEDAMPAITCLRSRCDELGGSGAGVAGIADAVAAAEAGVAAVFG